MDICNITSGLLPCWIIELLGSDDVWVRFTKLPFVNKPMAIDHMAKIIAEYPGLDGGRLRVVGYDAAMWQADLIAMVMLDQDITKRALSALRPEILCLALKAPEQEGSDGTTSMAQ